MFIIYKILAIGQKLTMILRKLTIAYFLIFSFSYTFANEKLILGLTGVALKEDITTLINLKNYLNEQTGYDIGFKFARSYAVMESFIGNNNVDFAYVCGATYVDMLEKYNVELLVLPTIDNKPYYNSLIITKNKSKYNKLSELKGAVFAMSDPDSNSAALVPQYEIYKRGYNFQTFFSKVIFTYDHGESIDSVLSGYVDAASVDSVVYKAFVNRYKEKAKELKIIEDFDLYPIPPFIIKKEIKNEVKKRLQEAFLSLKKKKKGREILKSMAIDSFIKPNNLSYEKINEIKRYIDKKRVSYEK